MKTKILKIFILVISLVMLYVPKVEAGLFDGGDTFIENGASQAGSTGQAEAAGAVNEIGSIMVSVAGYILVIGVIVIGIKYMIAKPDAKAKLKVQLIGLAVSTFVIFGAKWIWELVISAFGE